MRSWPFCELVMELLMPAWWCSWVPDGCASRDMCCHFFAWQSTFRGTDAL